MRQTHGGPGSSVWATDSSLKKWLSCEEPHGPGGNKGLEIEGTRKLGSEVMMRQRPRKQRLKGVPFSQEQWMRRKRLKW